MLDGTIRKIQGGGCRLRYNGALDNLKDINFYTATFTLLLSMAA